MNSSFSKNKLSTKNNKTNICKNFFLFFCLLNYLNKKQQTVTLFTQPKHNKVLTLLRPSFVNKISKKNYTIKRNKIVISIKFPNDKNQTSASINTITDRLNNILKNLS